MSTNTESFSDLWLRELESVARSKGVAIPLIIPAQSAARNAWGVAAMQLFNGAHIPRIYLWRSMDPRTGLKRKVTFSSKSVQHSVISSRAKPAGELMCVWYSSPTTK